MDAQVTNGILFVVTQSKISEATDSQPALLRYRAHSVEDGQVVFGETIVPFAARLVDVRFWDETVVIAAVGSL